MIIKQVSFVENRRGRLAEITGIIADAGINIRALSIAETTNFGLLRIIVDNPHEAERILREKGIAASVTRVLAVNVPDVPGGLHRLLKLLSEHNLSVEYMPCSHQPRGKHRLHGIAGGQRYARPAAFNRKRIYGPLVYKLTKHINGG